MKRSQSTTRLSSSFTTELGTHLLLDGSIDAKSHSETYILRDNAFVGEDKGNDEDMASVRLLPKGNPDRDRRGSNNVKAGWREQQQA